MKRATLKRLACGVGAVGALLFGARPAAASDWNWSVTPYFWLSDIGVDVEVNDRQVADVTVDISNILEHTDSAVMLHLEGQNGRNGIFFDGTYLNLGNSDVHVALPGPAGGSIGAKIDMKTTILEIGGIYNRRGDGQGFALLYGARIFDLNETIEARIDFPSGSTETHRYDAGGTLVDGLVGARYVGKISERWLFNARADVAAGGTEMTWNALLGFGRTFGKEGRHTLLAGYRHMAVELKEEDRNAEVESELTLSGPYLAAKLGF